MISLMLHVLSLLLVCSGIGRVQCFYAVGAKSLETHKEHCLELPQGACERVWQQKSRKPQALNDVECASAKHLSKRFNVQPLSHLVSLFALSWVKADTCFLNVESEPTKTY